MVSPASVATWSSAVAASRGGASAVGGGGVGLLCALSIRLLSAASRSAAETRVSGVSTAIQSHQPPSA